MKETPKPTWSGGFGPEIPRYWTSDALHRGYVDLYCWRTSRLCVEHIGIFDKSSFLLLSQIENDQDCILNWLVRQLV